MYYMFFDDSPTELMHKITERISLYDGLVRYTSSHLNSTRNYSKIIIEVAVKRSIYYIYIMNKNEFKITEIVSILSNMPANKIFIDTRLLGSNSYALFYDLVYECKKSSVLKGLDFYLYDKHEKREALPNISCLLGDNYLGILEEDIKIASLDYVPLVREK